MPNWIRMRDFCTVKSKDFAEKNKQLIECVDSKDQSSSLLIPVAATHSGRVNENWRFYRPDKMQMAAAQWVPENKFAKPVLFEHDKKGEVLGRVRTARYVDDSYKWVKELPTIKDSIFYDKKMDLFKSIDWIVDNLMSKPDYSGLGFIELGLNITNPEAVGKVLRDEYLTVSVGFQTNSAICSLCHQDWATDDKCEHHPGEKDEESGRRAFLICGDFKYEEISFVNFPADPFAGKISKDSLKDSLNRKFFMGLSHDKQQAYVAAAGMSMSDAVLDYDVQVVEDTVAEEKDTTKLDAEVQAAINNTTETKEDCGCDVDWSKEQLSAEDTEYFADEEGLYAELVIEMDAALAEGELKDDQLKDAKLSSEQRSKLGGSTFCGPNRSFPVPDCAHVVAARRLIGRAKASSDTKAKILACVSRKASSLSCGIKKDSAPQVTEKTDTIQSQDTAFEDYVKGLNLNLVDGHGKEAVGHYAGLEKCYKAADDNTKGGIRSLHYDVGQKWSADSALEWSKKYLAEKDKDSIIVAVKDWNDNQAAVTRLTDELKASETAINAAKQTAYETLKAIKRSLATQIVMFKTLTGNVDFKDLDKTQRDAKIEELSMRHVTSLKDAVTDIMSELKWSEVKATEVQPTDKVKVEPGKSVADNAQVSEVVETVNVETEEDKAKRLQAEETALLDRLSLMTAKERRLYLADLAFKDAKTASSKK